MDNDCDVCTLTETWLLDKDTISIASLNENGYKFYGYNRPDRIGGGLGIMCKSSAKIDLVSKGENDSFEYGEWKLKINNSHVTFVVIYRPPSLSESVFLKNFSNF